MAAGTGRAAGVLAEPAADVDACCGALVATADVSGLLE